MLFRTVKRRANNGWESCAFEDLKVGDHFELFEPSGESTKGIWVAVSPPYREEDWLVNWGIQCEPEKIQKIQKTMSRSEKVPGKPHLYLDRGFWELSHFKDEPHKSSEWYHNYRSSYITTQRFQAKLNKRIYGYGRGTT